MALREGFEAHEWRTLQLAPLWIFSAFVGRQSGFADAELDALWQSSDDTGFANSGLTREVLVSVPRDRELLLSEYKREERSVVHGLREAVLTAARESIESATAFTAALMSFAERIACARGPFGRSITAEDAATVGLVGELLDIDLTRPNPFDIRTFA